MKKGNKSFTNNLITIFIGSFASKILTFVLVPFYTSVLSTSEYGTLDAVMATATLLLPVCSCVIFEATLRFSLDETKDKKQVFSASIIVNCIGILVFLMFSPIGMFFGPIRENYFIFLIYFVVLVFTDTVVYFARGLNEIKEYTIANIVQTFLVGVCNIIALAVFDLGITGYLASYIIGSLFVIIYLIKRLKLSTYIINFKRVDKTLILEMLKYSIPLMPNSISWWVNSSLDRYFVIAFCGRSANGLYSVATKIPTLINLGNSIFNTAWQITAFEDFEKDASKSKFSAMSYYYYSAIFVMGALIVLLTKPLSFVMFSKEFYSAWVFAPFLVVASCMHCFSTFIGSVFTALKTTKFLSYSTIAGAFVNTILNLILIKEYGALGAAVATLASYITVYCMRFIWARKVYKFDMNITSDIICFVLLIFESIVIVSNIEYAPILAAIICVAILFIRKNAIVKIVINIGRKIFKHRN